MSDAAKREVTRLAMQAFQHAAESWTVAGDQLMTIVVTRHGEQQQLQRVDMTTADQSLAVARETVMHTEGIEAYAIAYLGHVSGGRYDFQFGAIESARQTLSAGGQPAIVVEAGNLGVDKGGALAMACLIQSDDQGLYLAPKPTHYTGTANWLRWREVMP
jgi:hypothetical protein